MSHQLQFTVHKGDYTKVDVIVDNSNTVRLEWDIDRYHDIFHGDLWVSDEILDIKKRPERMERIHCPVQNMVLVGELQLYSTYVLKSDTSTPVYMFRPLDYHFPSFYVHSNLRKKYKTNVWISIQVGEWSTSSKFPSGSTKECFGEITDYTAIEMALFHHFQLARKSFKIPSELGYSLPIDRVAIKHDIISIDPDGCTDIDDAFSFTVDTLYIHISDVLHNCGWFPNSLQQLINELPRSTSVYLKDTVIPMLAKEWSSGKASLLQGQRRHMLTLEIKRIDGEFQYRFYPSTGKIKRNATYDTYKMTDDLVQFVSNAYADIVGKYRSDDPIREFQITDTHTLVEAMMIMYNLYFGNSFSPCIVRTQQSSSPYILPDDIDSDIRQFLMFTRMNKANYEWKDETAQTHATLGLCYYTHVTSPIRRMTDLVNQYLYYRRQDIDYTKLCEDMNRYEKTLRTYYRRRNLLYLADSLYRVKEGRSCTVSITAVNVWKNHMTVYFPDERISIRVPIVHSKLLDIHQLQSSDTDIKIQNIQTGEITTLPLYKKIQVSLFGKPNMFAIDDSLKIKWH